MTARHGLPRDRSEGYGAATELVPRRFSESKEHLLLDSTVGPRHSARYDVFEFG